MRKVWRAITGIGIALTIWPFKWSMPRVIRWADSWGATYVVSAGPIDLQFTTDWGPRDGD